MDTVELIYSKGIQFNKEATTLKKKKKKGGVCVCEEICSSEDCKFWSINGNGSLWSLLD